MKAFANVTQFLFQPGLSAPFAADALGTPYTTPAELRETLGDLARLAYCVSDFAGVLQLSGASAAGEAAVKLTDGNTVFGSADVDLSAGTELPFSVAAVDLSNVGGSTPLYVEVEVTGAADAGVTAQVAAKMNVRHPLTVFGGC